MENDTDPGLDRPGDGNSCWDIWVRTIVLQFECIAERVDLFDNPQATQASRDLRLDWYNRLTESRKSLEEHIWTTCTHN